MKPETKKIISTTEESGYVVGYRDGLAAGVAAGDAYADVVRDDMHAVGMKCYCVGCIDGAEYMKRSE